MFCDRHKISLGMGEGIFDKDLLEDSSWKMLEIGPSRLPNFEVLAKLNAKLQEHVTQSMQM